MESNEEAIKIIDNVETVDNSIEQINNNQSTPEVKNEDAIKSIDTFEKVSNTVSTSGENVTLPSWDINPPFELLDRSE